MNEEGIDSKTGKVVVKVDAKYFRPAEVECVSLPVHSYSFCHSVHLCMPLSYSLLHGNPAKAERVLGWKRKVDFPALVKEMVEADLEASKSMVENHN